MCLLLYVCRSSPINTSLDYFISKLLNGLSQIFFRLHFENRINENIRNKQLGIRVGSVALKANIPKSKKISFYRHFRYSSVKTRRLATAHTWREDSDTTSFNIIASKFKSTRKTTTLVEINTWIWASVNFMTPHKLGSPQ